MTIQKKHIEKLLPHACEIARDAGHIIMDYYNNGAEVELKKDTKGIESPVTEADRTAEAYILEKLKELTPHIPIVSEEAISNGARPDTSGGTFWTVDPLDGTGLFINREDGFRVLIGLVIDHKPVLGVAHHPKSDIMYCSAGPGTATKINPDLSTEKITTRSIPKNGAHLILNKNYANLNKIFNQLSALTPKGASLNEPAPQIGKHRIDKLHYDQAIYEFCQIAEGSCDSHIHVSKSKGDGTNWWDIVPGHAILADAGGCVQNFDGQEILYKNNGQHDEYRIPPFMAFGKKEATKANTTHPTMKKPGHTK